MRHSVKQEAEILRLAGINPETLNHGALSHIEEAYVYLDPEPRDRRGYHSWDHILDVLYALTCADRDGVFEDDKMFNSFVVAALFHDIYYMPGAEKGHNETRSDLIMHEMEASLESMKADLGLSSELIKATAHHGAVERPQPYMQALFMDADIAGLACPYPRFIEQNEEVDTEFLTVFPPAAVAAGRKKFLEGMLNKKTIYLSGYFGSRLEWQARDNIQRLLEEKDAD